MSTRRNAECVRGFVDFPREKENTGEGGMFVRLVVIDREGQDWLQCCGGYHEIVPDETFVGWDREPGPGITGPDEWCYLMVATVGTTGWSGDFLATRDDLDEDGKAFLASVEKLYGPEGEVYLQTWLDT